MASGVEILVRAGASRTELAGIHDGAFAVRLAAKPVDGAANKALCKFIAERVGVPPSRVRIVRGERSRRKRIAVVGMSEADLAAALST